jgi:energy-coupling factor transporter ATP-binding protein EcfA2
MGAKWHRWDPHIHSPETVLNDQFAGEDAWERYLRALESKSPRIGAIGVTDYYLTDTYERLVHEKNENDRLTDVDLVFPNVELRLDIAAKTGFVNIHLLVSPDDDDHLEQLKRFLKQLNFRAYEDRFECTREGLTQLGKRYDETIVADNAALAAGATQFKVGFDQLCDLHNEIAWARENILIAVAGGSKDGSSGLQAVADQTIRRKIEKFAHIIFSSNPKQRDFWLGEGEDLNANQIRAQYGAMKPCLHGSDAHRLAQVGEVFENRFSWIKGSLTFDALRQACIDPKGRVFVGEQPPASAMPSQVVRSLAIENADWAETNKINLNPGLVTIVGARGSGKTALADMIAAGGDALPANTWADDDAISSSFLARARPLIGDGRIKLTWGGGEEGSFALDGSDASYFSAPRARYLSQRFVEDLCSTINGPSQGLIDEVERVIFDAHDDDAKEGALSFAELRDNRVDRFRQTRARETDSLAQLSERIGEEHEKERLISGLNLKVTEKDKLIEGYRTDQAKLVVKGTENEVARHAALTAARLALQGRIEGFRRQVRIFQTLQDEVKNMRASGAPEMLRTTRSQFSNSGLSDDQWADFLMDYSGDVDDVLPGYVNWANEQIAILTGKAIMPTPMGQASIGPDDPLDNAKLTQLNFDIELLEVHLQADKQIRAQFADLTRRINLEHRERDKIADRLKDAEGAAGRRKTLSEARGETYRRIFEAIVLEETALAELYGPLQERLNSSSGTLQKLSLNIYRSSATKEWAEFAETYLLDRRTGELRGKGTLADVALSDLHNVWVSGTAEEAKMAMDRFIAEYYVAILDYAPVKRDDEDKFREWLGRFAHWMFSTDHLSVGYGIRYDGIDIANLSPGTRGIVLLLLYLALDDADDRPLIIDQPEENLDPQSVNDELVPLFIAAKTRRQVIMVTHNANLVVNTDADQIIFASVGGYSESGLPRISYSAGGLENESTRRIVCEILEGGETAFKERARRLRVRLRR